MAHWLSRCLIIVAFCACSGEGRVETTREIGAIELSSDHTALVDGFHWAKQQSLAYAFEGDPVGKWYEAALPRRGVTGLRDR